MIVQYVRQTSDNSPFTYLNGPEDFNLVPVDLSHYKNTLCLLAPTEAESKLYVRAVGYEIAEPTKSLMSYYPTSTMIHYVLGGEGTFNGKPLKEGDCAVAFRDHRFTIESDPKHPLEFYWIRIRSDDGFQLEEYGFDKQKDVFSCSKEFQKEIHRIFYEMMMTSYTKWDAHCYLLGKMFELLSLHRYKSNDKKATSCYANVVESAKRMWADTSYGLSVEEIAKSLGFSRKHFSKIFRKETGLLPQRYVLEHKIKIARQGIEMGDNDFYSMAYRLGYTDYSAFSRAYKSVVGISPREHFHKFRNREKTASSEDSPNQERSKKASD
ncbi:MAG: helix-turn-helix domain-containing protein [Clostridia bacterium]|nr:helix-turn-helix domain-containing protein [Clostridia bacterium]